MLGFGFSKTKVLASAERYVQQGSLNNAIAEYQKILKHDSRDITVLNTVGDLYARVGQVEEATLCFREVAESYAGGGFTLKAIAVYKKLSRLNPANLDYILKLGELYRQQGLLNDARSQYMQAADALLRSGKLEEGSQLYEKILELDPDNISLQTKLVDLYTRSSKNSRAADLLFQLMENAFRRGVLDIAEQSLGRLATMLPNDPRVLEMKGRMALQQGKAGEAARYFENLPAMQSTEPGLQTLAKVYLQSGQLDKAIEPARRLLSEFSKPDFLVSCCDQLISNHRVPEALQIVSQFSGTLLTPGMTERLQGCIAQVRTNPDALEQLKKLLDQAGDTTHSAEILELIAHASVQSGDLQRARDMYLQLMRLEPQDESHARNYRQVLAKLEASGVASKEDLLAALQEARSTTLVKPYPEQLEEQIRTALAEAELLETFKSKSPQMAIAPLEAALASAPFDLRLNQQLVSLYARAGRFAHAAQCCDRLRQVLSASEQTEQADEYSELAAKYRAQAGASPAKDEISAEANPLLVEPAALPDQAPAETATGSDTIELPDLELPDRPAGKDEIDISEEWEQISGENVIEIDADADVDRADAEEIVEEIRFYLAESLIKEATFALQRLAEVAPDHPELPALRRQLAAKQESAQQEPEATPAIAAAASVPEIEFEPLSTPATNEVLTAPAGSAPPTDLAQFASELDASLGDDFTLVPTAFQPAAPVPVVSAAAAAAAQAPAPQAPVTPDVAAPTLPAPIAMTVQAPATPPTAPITAVNRVAGDDINPLLSDVFQEFKDEMEAGTTADQDPETHYNLGLAFKEMGLFEEAIGEFQKVCQSIDQGQPFAQAIQAYTWLAHCLVSKGVPEASFRWYQRALQAAPNEEVRTAIYYELGQAHETAGQKNEALKNYMEVYGANIDYRDVAERIRELKA